MVSESMKSLVVALIREGGGWRGVFDATTINYGHSANYLLVLMKIKGVRVPNPATPSHTLLYRAGE